MKILLKRMYLIFNISFIICKTLLLINMVPLNESSSLSNVLIFLLILIIQLTLSIILIYYEKKIYYKNDLSIYSYILTTLLLTIKFFVKLNNTLNILLIISFVIIEIFKFIYNYYFNNYNFLVNHLKMLPIIQGLILTIVTLINIFIFNYLAALILVIPSLLLETLLYLKLKELEPNSDYKLLGSVTLIIIIFFFSYYTELKNVNNFNIIQTLILPSFAFFTCFYIYKITNKKINKTIDYLSVE